MEIKLAKKSDAKRLFDMLYEVQALHANGREDVFKKGQSKYKISEIESIIENKNSPVYIGVEDDYIIAYAFCEIKSTLETNNLYARKTLYVDDFCVDKSVRGKGLGRELLDYVFNKAKEIDCNSVTLNVWHLNKGAEEFYYKCGMTPLKTTMEKIIK